MEIRPASGVEYIRNETPAEAAWAIADALDFLSREADKLGMQGVRHYIERASEMARMHAAMMHEEIHD